MIGATERSTRLKFILGSVADEIVKNAPVESSSLGLLNIAVFRHVSDHFKRASYISLVVKNTKTQLHTASRAEELACVLIYNAIPHLKST